VERPRLRSRLGPVATLFVLAALAALPRAALSAADAPPPGSEERIARSLLGHGFESVSVAASGDTVTVRFENRVYRYEMVAVGAAALLCAPELDSASVLELVPQTRGVANIAIAARASEWSAFLAGGASPEWFRERLTLRPGPAAARTAPASAPIPEANPSRWKLDLGLRPLLEFQFGQVNDPFQFGFWVAPEATISPFRGGLLTLQVKVRVEDELDADSPVITPGRTTLSAARWLPGAWLGAASAGLFADNRYGVAAEASRIVGAGAFEVRLGGDLSGFIEFNENETSYSNMEQWSSFAAVTYRTSGMNLETTLTGGRFFEGDAGGRLDILRRWGEVEVGFFGIKTESGSLGGFRLSVPLPVRRLGPPARIRFVTVPYFPWEYRESGEAVGGQVRLFDSSTRFRKGLHPITLRNEIEDLREARRFVAAGEGR
jgi:hypothetical protein